jgi:hypothetical protein
MMISSFLTNLSTARLCHRYFPGYTHGPGDAYSPSWHQLLQWLERRLLLSLIRQPLNADNDAGCLLVT